jgi:aminopeptidase
MNILNETRNLLSAHAGQMGGFEPAASALLTEPIPAALDDQLDYLHRMQRLLEIHAAGLTGNTAFLSDLHALNAPTWKDWPSLNAPKDKQSALADRLYLGREYKNGTVVLRLDAGSKNIALPLIKRHQENNIPFIIIFGDTDFQTLLINHADDAGIDTLAAYFLKRVEPVTMSAGIRESARLPAVKKDKAKHDRYAKAVRPYGERTMSGAVRWVFTVIPSEFDAARDGIPHDEYIRHYLEMCDQPLDYDDTPQRELIKELNAASTLRFTNDDGTDVSMSLIDHDGRHFTFCNSTNKRNVPGSEAFSAPRRDSVNGVIVAKGKHPLRGDGAQTIRHLTMWFENGKIVRFKTASAEEDASFQSHLDRDPNNYYIGEIGIGTNPYLKAHVANTLLVEKIGGQFHVALGGCYTLTDYVGDPVHVNNGNHTENGDHWDIATMLYGRGGRIYLDGRMIMNNGKFIDEKYAVLNDGWAAVPVDKRPPHRKDLVGVPTKFERELNDE